MTCKPVITVVRLPGFTESSMRSHFFDLIAKSFIEMKIGVNTVEDIVIILPPIQENFGNPNDIVIIIDLAQLHADSRVVMEKVLFAIKKEFPHSFVQVKLCEGNARYMAL